MLVNFVSHIVLKLFVVVIANLLGTFAIVPLFDAGELSDANFIHLAFRISWVVIILVSWAETKREIWGYGLSWIGLSFFSTVIAPVLNLAQRTMPCELATAGPTPVPDTAYSFSSIVIDASLMVGDSTILGSELSVIFLALGIYLLESKSKNKRAYLF